MIGGTGTYSVPAISDYHSFSLFGRSANVAGVLRYGVGTFQGSVLGTQRQVYRSGLLDLTLRFSVDLKGGPAMAAPQFVKWKKKLYSESLMFREETTHSEGNIFVKTGCAIR